MTTPKDGVKEVSHQLGQEVDGEGNMQAITPVCSCGWRGFGVAAYNDDQLARVKRQELGHMRDLQRGNAGVNPSDGDKP